MNEREQVSDKPWHTRVHYICPTLVTLKIAEATTVTDGSNERYSPAKIEGTITEVTNEFVLASDVLHDEKLEESNEGNDLG